MALCLQLYNPPTEYNSNPTLSATQDLQPATHIFAISMHDGPSCLITANESKTHAPDMMHRLIEHTMAVQLWPSATGLHPKIHCILTNISSSAETRREPSNTFLTVTYSPIMPAPLANRAYSLDTLSSYCFFCIPSTLYSFVSLFLVVSFIILSAARRSSNAS